MANEPRRVTVQSIRQRFESQAAAGWDRPVPTPTVTPTPTPDPTDPSDETNNNHQNGSCHLWDDGSQSNAAAFQNSCLQNRISIKRSPAFRTGTKLAAETLNVNKKPSLKRKPGVDRTSKPNHIQFNPPSSPSPEPLSATYEPPQSVPAAVESPARDRQIEEALKAPLPTGPAPKKPPRTFQHDIYMETQRAAAAGTTGPAASPTSPSGPQRPVRRKNLQSRNPMRPVSMPPFAISRSKTEPSLVRRPTGVTRRPRSPPPTRSGHQSLVLDQPNGWEEDEDLLSLKCRWLNPVQWNSFAPAVPEPSWPGTHGGSRRKSMPPDRMSASLLTIADQPGPWAVRRNRPGPADRPLGPSDQSGPASPKKGTQSVPTNNGRLPDLHYMCSPVLGVDDVNRWNSVNRTEESDCESDHDLSRSQLVEDRKIYVRRVSSSVCDMRKNQQSGPGADWSAADPTTDPTALFESLLVVALYYDRQEQRYVPYVKSHFPSHAKVPNGVEQFCFPDSSHWPPPFQEATDPYTIVLTDATGQRQYGYCRRIVPEGAQVCLPITYCLLTRHRATGFYHKVLNVLASRHGAAESQRILLLESLYGQSLPAPGRFVELPGTDRGRSAGQIQRLVDSRLEDTDLRILFEHLDESVILNVLGTLLLERKVVFLGKRIGLLSHCVEAVQSMLYPFVWQHTLVPLLPKAMNEIAAAPTPYVVGVLAQNVERWQSVAPDQGILVDVDSGKVLHCVGDESSILPRRSVRILKSAWQITATITQQAESARNALYSESFLRMFVDLCGHYQQYVQPDQSGHKYFERTAFVRNHPSQEVRMFLEWFTETAMFSLFVEARLRADAGQTLFEHKIMEHSVHLVRNSQLILRNSKVIGKKIKTIGDKLREMNVFS